MATAIDLLAAADLLLERATAAHAEAAHLADTGHPARALDLEHAAADVTRAAAALEHLAEPAITAAIDHALAAILPP